MAEDVAGYEEYGADDIEDAAKVGVEMMRNGGQVDDRAEGVEDACRAREEIDEVGFYFDALLLLVRFLHCKVSI